MAAALPLDRVLADDYVVGLAELPMDDLRNRRRQCADVESALSYLRRLVQGRLDVVHAELRRRAQGGHGDLAELVEELPEILREGGTRTSAGRLSDVGLPDVDHQALTADLDRIFDVAKLGELPELADDDVRSVADELAALERTVSDQRRALHERLDLLQAELVRRYKSGDATVDSLLT